MERKQSKHGWVYKYEVRLSTTVAWQPGVGWLTRKTIKEQNALYGWERYRVAEDLEGANMREQETLNAAAARIEELSMISKQVVQNLRDGAPSAYAQVYWLRREMSRVVATLGAGIPLGWGSYDDRMEKMK